MEHIIEEGIFIDPKFYCLKINENKYITKNKGLVNSLNMEEFKSILEGNELCKIENRWYKHIKDSTIKVATTNIKIKSNFLKRNPIKIDNNPKNIITYPFTVLNGEIKI